MMMRMVPSMAGWPPVPQGFVPRRNRRRVAAVPQSAAEFWWTSPALRALALDDRDRAVALDRGVADLLQPLQGLLPGGCQDVLLLEVELVHPVVDPVAVEDDDRGAVGHLAEDAGTLLQRGDPNVHERHRHDGQERGGQRAVVGDDGL